VGKKIVILGKRSARRTTVAQSRARMPRRPRRVDLNLGGRENRVDVDLLASPGRTAGAAVSISTLVRFDGLDRRVAGVSAEGLDLNVDATSSTARDAEGRHSRRRRSKPRFDSQTIETADGRDAAAEVPTVERRVESRGTVDARG